MAGLTINYNDGGPVMEITAGLRCPSFCRVTDTPISSTQYNKFAIPNYIPGSQLVVIPRNAALYSPPFGTDIIGTITVMTGYTFDGSILTFSSWDSRGGGPSGFRATVWQILPISVGNGLFIQESSDFFSATDATAIGSCVWRGRVTFTGSWVPPDTGFDKSRYLIFARWSQDDTIIEYDGNIVTAYQERDNDDVAMTVTLDIVIFSSGVPQTPGPGLNIFRRDGVCLFSLASRPFIYRNAVYTPSWDWQDVGDNFISLGRYGYDSRVSGGWDYLKTVGLMRVGNRVRCGRGKKLQTWTKNYSVEGRRLTNIQIPLVPAMY